MIAKTIPIAAARPDTSDSLRMAVNAIEGFLQLYCSFSDEVLTETKAGKIIAGYWYSRVPGFHEEDDFLHLTRDVLTFFQSGGERSRISDQLGWFFSGFMPTYGAACALLTLAEESQSWQAVQAFMHVHGYGNARRYVDTFDWKAGHQKAQAEVQAWADVLDTQVQKVQARYAEPPVIVALQGPMPPEILEPRTSPPAVPRTPPVSNPLPPPPAPPQPKPLKVPTPLVSLLSLVRRYPLILALTPTELNGGEEEWLRERDAALERQRLLVRDVQEQITVAVNTTNNTCKPQREANQANGAKCENDGYTLMEAVLKYQRLVDPPKGRGLDGLFEKLLPFDQPFPLPTEVTVPQPGKLVFIPMEAQPPQSRYDFTGNPPQAMYPKFVVFEAKNIDRGYGEDETDDIKKKAKERLKNTCDGQQLGKVWTERRIPQALERQYPGAKNRASRDGKHKEIDKARYSRWIFVCLPGPVGSNTKLYVIIDVVASGMDLDSMSPKARKSSKPDADNSY